MTNRLTAHDIHRPEYCGCPQPWQTPTGPLKDGSHYSDCLAAEVAEDMQELRQTVEDRDATIRVLRKRIKNLQRMANITITVEMPRGYATHLRQAIHHAITSRPDVFDQRQIDILNDASARLSAASDESFAEQYAEG